MATEETVTKEGLTIESVRDSIELCIDNDHITVSVDRFVDLVRAETTLEHIRRVSKKNDAYTVRDMVVILAEPFQTTEESKTIESKQEPTMDLSEDPFA